MADRIRNVEVAHSSSPTIRTAITLCLAAPTPMFVWVGHDRSLIYNDAAIPVLGAAHPAALGRIVPDDQNERWRTICHDLDTVRDRRETLQVHGLSLLPLVEGDDVVAIVGTVTTPTDETIGSPRTEEDASARILLVDGSTDRLRALRAELAHRWQVVTATSASAAIDACLADPPDVAIIDGDLTDLDATTMIRALRGSPRTANIVAIVATTHLESEVTAGGEANADDYVLKPISGRELRARVAFRLALSRVRAEELQKATRAKDDFLAMVGHELRNPLATVATMLQALLLRGQTRELELMERAVEQLTRLVDDLLESSRLARGKIHLQRRVTELAQVVDRAVEQMTVQLEGSDSKLTVSVPRVGCRVHCDPERLARAIANVLTNAVQHTSTAGRIAIDAKRSGERISLRITDNGIGITADRLASVFQAFQNDRTTGGLGLGLAIARNVVELHGGTISVASEGTGQGTTCTIEIPAASATSTESAPAPSRSRRRLMLVEDNDDAARALKTALEQLGYEVAVAHDAPIALNLARTFKPDIALLDLGLPVMDGWELAKRLRDALKPLPIVAVTARDQESDRQRSSELGFIDHLVKPINLPQLQQIVDSVSVSRREGS